MTDVESLPDDVGSLKGIIQQLEVENEEYRAQSKAWIKEKENQEKKIELLLEEIAIWKKRLFSPKSERYEGDDSGQQFLFNEAEAIADKEAQDNPEHDVIEVKSYSRQKKGRKKLPESLPREVIKLDIEETEKTCAAGKQRKFIRWEKSEKLDVKPPELKVIETWRAVYGCPDPACVSCEDAKDSSVKTAAMEPQLLDKTILTPGLAAFILASKYCDHLPYYRMEDIFNRYQIDISRQTMCRWTIQLYQKLKIFGASGFRVDHV
jgi:transposase